MADTHRCEQCGGDNPADARFCIDCGATLTAATGETTRLAGMRCPGCGTNNPEHARFCVVCGRGLVAGATPAVRPAPRPQPTAVPQQRPHSARQHSYPRVAPPPVAFPMAPPQTPAAPRSRTSGWGGNGPLLFAVALVVLVLSGNVWPGILWLIGISSFVGARMNGRGDKAFQALVWWGGLALLFATGTFWPGILLLIFIGMALGGQGRRFGGPW